MNSRALLPDEWPSLPSRQEELPYDDGEPMETPIHREQMNLLIESLVPHFEGRRDVFVGGNMFLYYSMIQTRSNDFRGPDFFVVLGARSDRERLSWVMWEEESKPPTVVIELLSQSTEKVDRGRKKQIYAGLGVQAYYLYDPLDFRLEGFRLRGRSWFRLAPAEDGELDCPPLGLQLGLREGSFQGREHRWLRWIRKGEVLPSGEERARLEHQRAARAVRRADQEAQRAAQAILLAEQEAQRARAAEERARALEDRLRALGLDPEGG